LMNLWNTDREAFEKEAKLLELGKEDPIAAAMISGAESFAVNLEARRLEFGETSLDIVRESTELGLEATETIVAGMEGAENFEHLMRELAMSMENVWKPLQKAMDMLVQHLFPAAETPLPESKHGLTGQIQGIGKGGL